MPTLPPYFRLPLLQQHARSGFNFYRGREEAVHYNRLRRPIDKFWKMGLIPSTHCPLYDFDLRATHARTLLPAALASVSFGFVLVRVRIQRQAWNESLMARFEKRKLLSE